MTDPTKISARHLTIDFQNWYNGYTKGTTAHKGLTDYQSRITTLTLAKVSRVVFLRPFLGLRKRYVLLTIIKNKGKQHYDECSKSHQVFEIHVHPHHLPSMYDGRSTPLQHDCSVLEGYHIIFQSVNSILIVHRLKS